MDQKKKKIILDYLILTVGILLVSADVHYFRIPNQFVPGGCTGIGILIGAVFKGVNTTNIISILSLVFLLIGWIFLGKGLGLKITYCSLLFTAAIKVLDLISPSSKPLTDSPLLELLVSVAISCIGTALVLKRGGSTGGTEIVAIIIRKYTKADISIALIVVDVLIAGGAFFCLDFETGVFSMVYLIVKSFGVQYAVDAINNRKNVMIITSHPKEVSGYINQEIHRGATEWDASGAFTDDQKKVILTISTKAQAAKIRAFAKQVDPEAFIVINDCHEIYGNGFMSVNDNF